MNGFAGKRLELGWGLEKFLLRRVWIDSFGRVGGVLFRQHLRRFRHFLLGGHVRRIDALGLFELGQSRKWRKRRRCWRRERSLYSAFPGLARSARSYSTSAVS